jgi:hypothetical protein
MGYLHIYGILRKVRSPLFHELMLTRQRTKADDMSLINVIKAENGRFLGLARFGEVSAKVSEQPTGFFLCKPGDFGNRKSVCKSLTFIPPNRMDDERHLRKYIRSILARVSLSSVAKVLKILLFFLAVFLIKIISRGARFNYLASCAGCPACSINRLAWARARTVRPVSLLRACATPVDLMT